MKLKYFVIVAISVLSNSFHPLFSRNPKNQKAVQSNITPNRKDYKADIIIYGGTSAAVIAAVEAAKSGKAVLMVSPDTHLGGLSSGGLGFTDTGNKSTIGGLSREFYHRVWLRYNNSDAWKWQKHSEYGNKGQGTVAMDGENRTMWIFEPHVAEQVFEDFVAENKITVLRNEWLDRQNGLVKKDGSIVSFKTHSGKVFSGKIFIDATYEGDLMAAAGVSYHVGREPCSVYNETWNGVQADVKHHEHYFKDKIDPYKIPGKPESGLLYGISPEKIAPNCKGDNKIQAYCFRLCMSNHPDNRIPFPKPENYNPANYELLGRVFDTGWRDWFKKFDTIPNRKTDTNNHGPFSSDFIGMNYDYPEASYERRKEIIKEHEDYQKGLLYYVANDPRVPKVIHDAMQQWGLAKDEFIDNGNWSRQLYIREARRMLGVYVTTENDVLAKREVPQPVGMGSYGMDSHNIQRYVTSEGYVQNEGDVGVSPDAPYSISYGSIIPKKNECNNLLVPVCVSSSHIAYGSIRMEPVFMILGQSAAIAACLAIDRNKAVQDVPYDKLKAKLLQREQVITFSKAKIQIVNAGIPGNNSSDLLNRFDQEISQAKPDVAIIMVGTNDMLNTKNLVTYSDYRSNLRTMVTRLKANGIKPLLICPPPADTAYLYERHDRKAYAEMPNEKMDSVRNIIKELAVENSCGNVDVYDAFVKLNVPKHNSDDYIRNEKNSNARDGVHPTPKGYELIAKAVFNYLISTKTVFSGMKIICLGDSITNGAHVIGAGTATGETYPGVLYRLLDIYIQKN